MSIFTSNIELSPDNYPTIRPTLDLNFAATKTLDRRITFTRDSLGTFTGEDGLVKYASNNVPRFDHDPTTGESLGLLIEESRTNDFAHSEVANDVWLAQSGLIKTANTTDTKAPDGSFTATKLASQATSPSTSQIYDTLGKSSGGVQSIWAKKGTHNVLGIFDFSGTNGIRGWFDLNTGEHRCGGGSKVAAGVQSTGTDNNNTNMIEYPNGWYRCIYYEAANMTYAHFRIVDFDSNNEASSSSNTIYLWGAQAEVNKTFATSFIPSLSTLMPAENSTRAQDTAKITGTNFTDFYNQSEGTLVSSSRTLGVDLYQTATFEFTSSNSNAERIALDVTNSYNRFYVYGGSSGGSNNNYSVVPAGTLTKNALAYKLNDVAGVRDGGTVLNDTVVGIPIPNIDRANIGHNLIYGHRKQQHIARLSYYPKRLPDVQLQGLTQQ